MSEIWQDPYTISVIVFAVLVGLYIYKDRKKFQSQSGIIFLRRTQAGKKSIVRLGEKYTRGWNWLGNAGVVIGFCASVFVVITLIFNLVGAVQAKGTGTASGLAFLIPSPTQTAVAGPGFLAVPFWYWIIAIALLVIVHEGLHGIMSAAGRIKIKSLGWGLLLIIPLAFVEPDEKRLQKKSFMVQQRVFAAGSLANFILATVCLLILVVGFSGIYQTSGASFQSTVKGLPAEQANLTGTIVAIENYTIKDAKDVSTALKEIGSDKTITIKTKLVKDTVIEDKEYTLKTVIEPNSTTNRAFIGISGVSTQQIIKTELLQYAGIILFFQGLFFFLFLINFGVGLANLLPIGPLDGGRMWDLVFKKAFKKSGKKIASYVSWFALILLIANFAVPFV